MRGQQLRKCMVPHGKLNLLDWKMLAGVFQFFVFFIRLYYSWLI